MLRKYSSWLLTVCMLASVNASPAGRKRDGECEKTTVAILGAGVAGIAAAQALSNQSVTDFLILEYNSEIGGRIKHTTFGSSSSGTPYTIELGASWVQGLGTENGPENPIWTFAKKYNISNTYSNYSDILTYNETGYTDYSALFDEYDEAYAAMEQDAGIILKENLQDRSTRAGEALAGWKPGKDMAKQAVEWWMWDFETSHRPEESSLLFGIAGYNFTFYQWSEENNFVTDQRGFNTLVKGIASTYLVPNDPRLRLNTVVQNISYSDTGVTVYNSDGTCISAAYAICTFSLGVLQNDAVTFSPTLPSWKRTAIETFNMGTYTKIFLQFPSTFWPNSTQFFLYADPHTRGYYPVFQSLSHSDFLPESNILFVTVVGDQSYRIESQDEDLTKAEIMTVLRDMFPDIQVPEPTAFLVPKWSSEPWVYGSYSDWPVGTTLEMHQNLRANVDRLYFAGEATSPGYFGFLQGAWFEGVEVGQRIAGRLAKGRDKGCRNQDGGCGSFGGMRFCMGRRGRGSIMG